MGKSLPHLLLNGTSTFTWKWILPVNSPGLQNDPNKLPNDPSQPFPIPPLYALAIVDPYADATPGTNTTMACTATITDGWGWSQSFTIPSSQNPQIPDSLDPRRKIVSAVLRSDNVNSDIKLSPSVKVDINSIGTGKAYGYLTAQADALIMDYPYSNVRPDLGDPNAPGNQFVYSSDANGSLTMDAFMGFNGFTSDIDWLTNKNLQSYKYAESLVDWQFDRPDVPAPGGGQPARTAMERLPNQNEQTNVGQLSPYTIGYNSHYGLIGPSTVNTATSQNLPALIFNGLPLHNAGFGNHTVTLGIKSDLNMAQGVYSPSQTAYIQTFFPGLAANWPSSDGVTPNWYYYYNQVFPVMGASNDYDAQYSPNTGVSFTQYDGSNPEQPTGHIQLKNDAYPSDAHPSYTMHVFDISPNPDPDDGKYYVRCIGTLQMYGIMSYIYLAAHEQGHVNTFRTLATITSPSGQSYTYPIITTNAAAFGDPYLPSSSDGDMLWDAWEDQHHMKSGPNMYDTTHAYNNLTNGDVADDEVVADIDSFEHVFAQVDTGAWKVDWADRGLNAQPYFIQEPYNNQPNNFGKAPTFYIKFLPNSGATPYPNQPNIQPVVTKDGYYEIRNIQDLKNLYPNLVTKLGQM